jgi:hypothetical protein
MYLNPVSGAGDERTMHPDPAFAFRLLADISAKALSPDAEHSAGGFGAEGDPDRGADAFVDVGDHDSHRDGERNEQRWHYPEAAAVCTRRCASACAMTSAPCRT